MCGAGNAESLTWGAERVPSIAIRGTGPYKQKSCNKHGDPPGKGTAKAGPSTTSVSLGNGEDQAGAALGLQPSKGDTDKALNLYSWVRGKLWPAER